MSARSASKPSRIAWVDSARGLGIVLVVYGHTARGLTSAGLTDRGGWLQAMDRWIYAFHMPLFFVLAGIFVQRLLQSSWKDFLLERAATVLYPYVVWSILQTALQVVFSGAANHPVDPAQLLRILVDPVMQFWFLYALLHISVLHRLLVSAVGLRLDLIVVGVGILIWFLPHFGLTSVWPAFGAIKRHFVYYAIGAAFGRRIGEFSFGGSRSVLLAVGGFGALSALIYLHETDLPVGSFAAACSGILGTIGLATLLPRDRLSGLRVLGMRSLEIYVAHTIASAGFRIVLQKVFGVTSLAVHLVGGTLVGLLAPLLLLAACNVVGFRYAFSLRALLVRRTSMVDSRSPT